MRELNEVLTQLLSGGEVTKKSSLGGVKAAARIMRSGPFEEHVASGIVGRFQPPPQRRHALAA